MPTLKLTCFDFLSRFLPQGAVLTTVQLKPTLLDLTHANTFRLSFAIPSSGCSDKLSYCLPI